MEHQPVQSKQTPLRRIWQSIRNRISERTLAPAFAFAALPGGTLAQVPMAPDSALTATLACVAGILGVSAALLYRHMHAAEEKLKARLHVTETELRALLAMSNDTVLLLNWDGTIRDGNPATEEMFGVSVDDLPTTPLTDLIAQPLSLGELAKHGPVGFQVQAVLPGGRNAQVEMALSPIEYEGKCHYIALIREFQPASDAGDSSKAQLAEAAGKFTHDLNNELTTIIGNLSMVLMSSPADPANHERIIGAKRTALRAQALSNRLQALAAGEDPDAEPVRERPAPSHTKPSITPFVPPPPQQQAPAAPASSRAPRILVLDDEEAICALVATALDSMGFEVTESLSVAPALEACEKAMQEGRPYDLVISDLSLPGGMNGIEAVSRLRNIDPKIQAIVSTGYSSDPIISDCRRHGFDAAIAKPFDLGKLGSVVRSVLASKTGPLLKTA